MRLKTFLIPELQIHLQSEKILKLNYLKEWHIDMGKKITILKGYLSACRSVKKFFLLPVEQKEPYFFINY
jgi:hypothetical protein